ncbi:thermonuclease family protein [Methylocystis suflitae]|uniref:thermonuclease family protein n=1 Tax=Methylocystis suflitae TaxID=2951405 RepID=UPI00210B46D3|nr:thermonuclease family protein [Methylocystis suflitae]MCQ4191083.1 thermonuclease family protein [Methylocystis suflitae]
MSCREKDVDRYGRTVADCRVRGEDIELWLVRSGHAFAYRRIRRTTLPRSRRPGTIVAVYGQDIYAGTLGMAQRATRRHSIAWAAASPPPAPLQGNLLTVH